MLYPLLFSSDAVVQFKIAVPFFSITLYAEIARGKTDVPIPIAKSEKLISPVLVAVIVPPFMVAKV